MNLYDMFNRKDPVLAVGGGVELGKMMIDGVLWRGFFLAPSAAVQLKIGAFGRWYPFADRPDDVGWRATIAGGGKGSGDLLLSIQDRGAEVIGRRLKLGSGAAPRNVGIPWLVEGPPVSSDLCLRYEGDGRCFLAIHRALDRKQLLATLTGRGVELGPGHQPQIKPSGTVAVSYIEQMPAEQWRALYAGTKIVLDDSLWDLYKIGEASSIPEADGSLDFIFSSHVFEHLVNPIGHLLHWQRKLRPGGTIVAVVPDCAGCKDYQFYPTDFEELLDEHLAGLTEPTLYHYRRYYAVRNPAVDPQDMLDQRKSIHLHFFTRRNILQLLRHAVDVLGFAGFALDHADNHKDFHFTLTKGADDHSAAPAPERVQRARQRFSP
jgi:SAM-dependent methyltransferase